MRLASLARVTSTQAISGEDSPDVLSRLDAALEQVRTEFARGQNERSLAHEVGGEVSALRHQLQTFLDLMTQRGVFLGEVDSTIRRITEAAAMTINVERVSVWWLDGKRTKITCADLFERTTRKHSSGIELMAKDFPAYFRAIETERTIAAHDAHKDPRTSCFSQPYLGPLGINSMLDVPIWAGQKMVGVVCHEHIGPKRTWLKDDETFAYLMASFVALALERTGKVREL
ncbi:MAG: GAF domain-containing protein [Polyangiales bacterium]